MPAAEIVTFRLKDGVSDDVFVQAARAIGPWLRDSKAMISRSLTRDDDGLWTDYIIWVSMKAAKEAAAEVMQQPEFAPMGEMIGPDSVNMRHAHVLMQMD
jgi:hypothetical protein